MENKELDMIKEGIPLGKNKNFVLKKGFTEENTYNLLLTGIDDYTGLVCVFTEDELKSIKQIVVNYIENKNEEK